MLRLLKIKSALALIVLACFFLPLSQCTIRADHKINESKSDSHLEEFVPYKSIEFREYGEIGLFLLFAWPILAVSIGARQKKKILAIAWSLAELAACAISLYYLYLLFALWSRILIGGYIAIASYLLYATVSVVCIFQAKRDEV